LSGPARFPFSSVVGQDAAKLALSLAAVDPLIGGVLLRGQKGSAKTTLARGMATLLGRLTDLPLGTTEDRLIGTFDVAAALAGGGLTFRPGLLAAADGGLLYVDEVNLLADHLVDVLLDVAVSGENVVERDGVSHRHPARFVLVGSMNPEEGEVRPQLLDRFGLCVDVSAPLALDERIDAVRRRLVFDARPTSPEPDPADVELADRLRSAVPAAIGDDVLHAASRLALSVGVEGLRADLTLCRAAAANAGLDGRARTDVEDVRRVAHLVLVHRARRGPHDPPTAPRERLDEALAETLGPDPSQPPDQPDAADRERQDGPVGERPLPLGSARRTAVPPPPEMTSPRGRFVRAVPAGDRPGAPISALSTARALAGRRELDGSAVISPDDLRVDERTMRAPRLVVLCVDLSGSMRAPARAEAATGAVLGLLEDVYQRRHRVALVGFGGDDARIVLAPTSSVEIARNRLHGLTTGGRTPLAAGLRTSLDLIARDADGAHALLAVLTDGRATAGPDAFARALDAAATVQRRGIDALVLDCEDGPVRLGLAGRVAAVMGADLVALTDPTGAAAAAAIVTHVH
jgi:magnesium chelatase subunit D